MSREQEVKTHQPRRRGPMGHGMQPGEKPKDFKKSIKKLMSYIGLQNHSYPRKNLDLRKVRWL